jgi:hypothetical protein
LQKIQIQEDIRDGFAGNHKKKRVHRENAYFFHEGQNSLPQPVTVTSGSKNIVHCFFYIFEKKTELK